jgi:hypothetical protein
MWVAVALATVTIARELDWPKGWWETDWGRAALVFLTALTGVGTVLVTLGYRGVSGGTRTRTLLRWRWRGGKTSARPRHSVARDASSARRGGGEGRRAASRQVDERRRAARDDYLARFYGVDRELPTHYDLVVNTDVISPDRAADLLLLAAT